MDLDKKLPISDIKLINNKNYNHRFNRIITQDLENYSQLANVSRYGLKIREYFPSKILIWVYKDIYRIKEGFFSKAILFKNYFEEFESKNKVGKIKFDWQNIEKDEHDEFNIYNGDFSAYVLIFQKLFHYYFNEEVIEGDKYHVSIWKYINAKAEMVSVNPFNYFLINQIDKLTLESEFTSIDIKEYVELTLDIISGEIDKSKRDVSKTVKGENKNIFLNDEYEEFFMYVIKENEKKQNRAFFSALYRCFLKNSFLYSDYDRPRFYFEFLETKGIFSFYPKKLTDISTTSDECSFIEFDKLYKSFLLNKE